MKWNMFGFMTATFKQYLFAKSVNLNFEVAALENVHKYPLSADYLACHIPYTWSRTILWFFCFENIWIVNQIILLHFKFNFGSSLQWRQYGRTGVSNHQPRHCLLNRIFRRRSNKTSKLRVTGLCVGNSLVTDESPAQMASNAGNVSIWWRHHVLIPFCRSLLPTITQKRFDKKWVTKWKNNIAPYFIAVIIWIFYHV